MTGLKTWARDVMAIILLGGILELAVPLGSLHRYTRLVVGLLILLSIMSPIVRLLGDPQVLAREAEAVWAVQTPAVQTLQGRIDRVQARARAEVRRLAAGRIEAKAREIAQTIPGVEEARAEVTFDGTPEQMRVASLRLQVKGNAGARKRAEEALRSALARELGLESNRIAVEWSVPDR